MTSVIDSTDVTINVEGKVQIGAGSFFGSTSGTPLLLNVAGRVVRISQSAVVNAAILAPDAKVKIQRDGTLLGCYCARASTTDKHVTLICTE